MTQLQMDKLYDPKKVEPRWYKFWLDHKLFHANNLSTQPTYVIMIPPPNVTGMLTMGHILNNTIQDLLIRYKKMAGFETLWQPGTDHAGIATQNKVEQQLAAEGRTRHDIGREALIQRTWEWRRKYGGIILQQLKKLGAACDWDRERFTMEEDLSKAVREVFIRLYHKGLIYRGKRLINWCPRCHTALADEEAPNSDTDGFFWDIAYPIKGETGQIVVSTTRPETMLGDTAVAVHPDDPRYQNLIGKIVVLPLMNREIPIIADIHADPDKGSGAVKITPAHDFNDFQVAQRHQLALISVIDDTGTMNENAGPYQGMERFEARKKIVADLEQLGLLKDKQAHVIPIPHCYRCDDVVEPFISEQWFVRMKPLAEPALQAVKDGKIHFHPRFWEETYFHWLENVQDWCISRQIWWGHRIPVYYCEANHINVAHEMPAQCSLCTSTQLRQDEDVLDTWFSSWLWPFSTLGWPEKTEDLNKFFPGHTLVTGPDIIFFWVARMIMASLEFLNDIPFRDVYFNGMIRDMEGKKMSKSLGNSPDPLWLIDGCERDAIGQFGSKNPSYRDGVPAYGADAVRVTMLYLTPVGGDINFDHTLVQLGQKFANKIWNAARFVLSNLDETQAILPIADIRPEELEIADRWILSRLNEAIMVMRKALDEFKLNDATHALYAFIWSEYCDWYLELVKTRLYENDNARTQQIARTITVYILDNIVRLAHPFMPFITEEIWQAIPESWRQSHSGLSVMTQPYPVADEQLVNRKINREMILIQQVIGAIRNIRGEMNVPPGKEADLHIISAEPHKLAILAANETYLRKLARTASIYYNDQKPRVSASAIVQGIELYVPLEGLIDLNLEQDRLQKEILRVEGILVGLNKKLSNPDFLNRAPADIIEKERKKKSDFETNLMKLRENLTKLTEIL